MFGKLYSGGTYLARWFGMVRDSILFLVEVHRHNPHPQAPLEPGWFCYLVRDVRITFTTVEQIETSMATLEATEADTEQSEFLRYDESAKVTARLFDHKHRDTTKPQRSMRSPSSGAEFPSVFPALVKSAAVLPNRSAS